jgi:hypothetical protein
VLDQNTSVTKVIEGPKTYSKLDNEKITSGSVPLKMVSMPPRTYLQIKNPVVIDPESKQPVLDKHNQAKLRHGESEYRF